MPSARDGTFAANSSRGGENGTDVNKKLQSATSTPLRLDFVPLADCVPLVMAHELGLFRKYGLRGTLSRELGRTSGREEIKRARREKIFTFGVVSPFSSHRHLLRKAHGIDPERDVRIVAVPPPQRVANLKSGNLDGFCVGEPWNSVAQPLCVGWIAATSTEPDPVHQFLKMTCWQDA